MRAEQLLLSLVALLLSFSLLAGGLFLVLFPEAHLYLRVVGGLSLGIGALLLLLFYLTSRRRYLLIKMGGVAIHERLIRHYAQETLEELFPSCETIDCDVIVHKKGKVEFLARIPYLSDTKRAERLEEIETKLSALLVKYCGCKGPFIFNVSFS